MLDVNTPKIGRLWDITGAKGPARYSYLNLALKTAFVLLFAWYFLELCSMWTLSRNRPRDKRQRGSTPTIKKGPSLPILQRQQRNEVWKKLTQKNEKYHTYIHVNAKYNHIDSQYLTSPVVQHMTSSRHILTHTQKTEDITTHSNRRHFEPGPAKNQCEGPATQKNGKFRLNSI